jgi:hypothetical protein
VTPVEPNSRRAFEETTANLRWRVDVLDAGHSSFTSICLLFDTLADAGLPPALLEILLGNVEQGCGPDLIPIAEAQRVTNLYATAFFKKALLHEPYYWKFLEPDYANRADLPVDITMEVVKK